MKSPEFSQSPETPRPKLDTLIVPGKDIGVRYNPQEIRNKQLRLLLRIAGINALKNALKETEMQQGLETPISTEVVEDELSLESALNVIAAGKLFKQGIADRIIFTTGHTAGTTIRSEAKAMRNLLKAVYPEIPESAVILEEKSKDTSGNAEEVSKIVWLNNFMRVGIVDVGFHLKNAVTLFRRYAVKIADEDSFVAEEIVADKAINPNVFPDNYNNTPIVRKERQKELIRTILLNTIDRKGKLLRIIAEITRKSPLPSEEPYFT